MGAAAAGPPCPHLRLRPAALYILPPGTGRDFYSGRAPLPPPFGAGPAGQTDGRTDLLPKHNSTSSPEHRTSTRRINATLDRTWSVGLVYPGLGLLCRGRLGGVFWCCCTLECRWHRPSAGSGSLFTQPRGARSCLWLGHTHVPFCKRGIVYPGVAVVGLQAPGAVLSPRQSTGHFSCGR